MSGGLSQSSWGYQGPGVKLLIPRLLLNPNVKGHYGAESLHWNPLDELKRFGVEGGDISS